jgi:hypothetical protein
MAPSLLFHAGTLLKTSLSVRVAIASLIAKEEKKPKGSFTMHMAK